MADPTRAFIRTVLDGAFTGKGWQGATLSGALRGVTVREALYRPRPKRKCIWEHILHAAYWKHRVAHVLSPQLAGDFVRSPSNWPRVPRGTAAELEEMWKADAVREGELFASVVEATAETVRLRLYGSVLLASPGILHTWPDHKFIKNIENRYSARLEGEVIFDRARNRISRFDVVVLGDFSGRWFAGEKGWKEATVESPLALAFAFELDTTAFDLPPERRRPRSFVHAYIFRTREDHYWDPEAWLTDWNKTRTRPK